MRDEDNEFVICGRFRGKCGLNKIRNYKKMALPKKCLNFPTF